MFIVGNAHGGCILNKNSAPRNHYFKENTYIDPNYFKLEQFEDIRIIDRENHFFVWKANNKYFFTNYVTYSGIGYTREMIVNSEFFCSADELSYILKKNKGNIVRVVLITNPFNSDFLDRRSKLLVRKLQYADFIQPFLQEATANNVTIEIDDEENFDAYVRKLIK